MISFVNDSGVIEVTDTSVSPPIIERWLKDMLRIEQYVDIIRFTGTLQDTPGRKEYQLTDEATAITERQTLYEYLEDYGGGTPIDSYQGQMGRTSSGVVNIATSGTYQATGLIGTLDTVISDGIALSTTDQLGLKNISGKTVDFKIFASADIEGGNNRILGIILAKNGVTIAQTECRAPTGNGTSFAKLFTNWIIPMADGDQVTIYVTNHSTSGNITIDRCRMLAITSGGVSGGGGGGEVNTASNVGGEKEVFKQKTGVDLEFRTLKEGDNVTITQNTDDLEIDVELIDIYDEDGIVKANVKNINVIYPLIATDAGANTAALQVDTNSVLSIVMLEVARFNGLATDQRAMVYVASVNKLYVRQGAFLRIYDCDTYELIATISGGLVAVDYTPSAGEVWAQGTTTNTQRIDINTNTLIANIALTGGTLSKYIEYTNAANTNTSAYAFRQAAAAGIVKIDTTSFAVTNLAWTVSGARVWAALCLNPASAMHRHIVATASNAQALSIWDPETDTEVATAVNPSGIFSGTGIRGIEYSASIDCFIVADSANNIVAYLQPATTSTFTVVRIIRTMQAPSFIVIDEANGLLLVSHQTLPTANQPTYVSKFRLSDGKPLGIVPTGSITNTAFLSAYMAKKGTENTVFVSGNNTSVITPISEVKYL